MAIYLLMTIVNKQLKMKKNKKATIKVKDITGNLEYYVTLEEFMERTAYIEEGNSDEES